MKEKKELHDKNIEVSACVHAKLEFTSSSGL